MVDCATFLDLYSEFRDGFLPPDMSRDFEAHLDVCASCARYDQVVAKGTRLVADLPELEPSADFLPRLQNRISDLERETRAPGQTASGTSASAVLSIAAALALAAWLPVLRTGSGPYRLPAVTAGAPDRDLPALFMAGPLLRHTALLHRDLSPAALADRDQHLLFRYYPVGEPIPASVAFQVAGR
ncbi:MAG: zf-HC2 domain-containing protein [Gemmatimonadetes bacterium]|nr:zf-HC2 domain-containing protein [Gemmatimonadota bacterium]